MFNLERRFVVEKNIAQGREKNKNKNIIFIFLIFLTPRIEKTLLC
jgi:hypothetical protein